MINRVLIRLKIVQIVYAYYQNGGKNIDTAEKELFYSLSKAYDLYNYLLLLIVAITQYANKKIELGKSKFLPTKEDLNPNMKFANNRFAIQLESNVQLADFVNSKKKNWDNNEEIIKSLYNEIIESDIYKAYMEDTESSYAADREFWRKIYKNFICNNSELDSLLEEESLYWNDDKEIVDTFVLKTIKRFDPANGAEQELLPEFKDEEDKDYAKKLFRYTILNAEQYRELMNQNTRNWEMKRLSFMDIIIMQIALAEITSIPNIPINVTINEYLEISKLYSTPKSPSFINGMLDNIVNQLKKAGKLLKN